MGRSARTSAFGITPADVLRRMLGVSWVAVMASLLAAGAHDHRRVFSSRSECGTDPLDILRIGEIVDESTLRFVIDAHCTNARYLSDELIELRFGGVPVEVETRTLSAGGARYFEIVSIGGWSVP